VGKNKTWFIKFLLIFQKWTGKLANQTFFAKEEKNAIKER
jgi:hypothetical protein